MSTYSAAIENYIDGLAPDRSMAIRKLLGIFRINLPSGFIETMTYGMPGFVVSHDIYPAGYHSDKSQPLPFISIGSQKNHIALYHMAIYMMPDLLDWFRSEYTRRTEAKPDMGKSCIRFSHPDKIPFTLIGELASRVTVEEWIRVYEANRRR
jgi:hypothetical protein